MVIISFLKLVFCLFLVKVFITYIYVNYIDNLVIFFLLFLHFSLYCGFLLFLSCLWHRYTFNLLYFTQYWYFFIIQFQDHTRFVQSVRFSPDGESFVSGGFDGKMFLYKASDYSKVGEFGSPPPAHGGGIYAVSSFKKKLRNYYWKLFKNILIKLIEDMKIKSNIDKVFYISF